jgi:HD-GYP domain-containing protein (c-di-GMP phosphodiesterase class II)
MVRLSDSFSPSEAPKSTEKVERRNGESLPEVIVLTRSQEVVSLVRDAIEERGYRLHHALTPDEVKARLKAVGKVILVIDGRVAELTDLLTESEVSNRPRLLLVDHEQKARASFPGISDSQIVIRPVDPALLQSKIEELATGITPANKMKRGQIFSSLPDQPDFSKSAETDKAVRSDETPADSKKDDAVSDRSAPSPLGPPVEAPGGAAKMSDIISTRPHPPKPAEPAEKIPEKEIPRAPSEPVEVPAPDQAGEIPGAGQPAESEPSIPPVTEPSATETGEPAVQTGEPAPVSEPPAAVSIEEFEKTKSDAYKTAVEAVRKFLGGHRSQTNPPLGDVANAVEEMIKELDVSDNLALEVVHYTPDFEDVNLYHAHHLINVAHLAITIGKGLNLSPKQLFELALATSIHDVGETQLPEGLILRSGKLDDSGYSQMQQHPSYGRELLKPYARAYPWLPDVIYQEHERFDGTGYPEGLKGDEIHLYARIIGLADTYEALTHSRPFREQMIPFNVLQQLIRLGGRLFHSDLVKALIDQISVFPLGSKVQLNTGEVGKVIKINHGYPLRPMVQVLVGSDGSVLQEGRSVDLKAEPMLYITGPAEDQQ